MPAHERELTAPVDLCAPDGRLNPRAVGWSRTPLHRCALPGWGRRKKGSRTGVLAYSSSACSSFKDHGV
ncbi:DUF2804 family protein [Nocardiopsis deserti]|uniref:DUF2804 family protein n=1 Tax=Nocardiopsis deserti TaxID=2605988 RepID=UPI00295899E0|nr:hypothetical protein [Nocardiopsis deserti]